MRNTIFIIFTFIIYVFPINRVKATTLFKAKTSVVFIDNEEKGEYAAGIIVEDGIIKKGDIIDAINKKGTLYTFKVIEIKTNDVPNIPAKKGDNAFLVLQSTTGKIKNFNDEELILISKGTIDEGVALANSNNTKKETPTNTIYSFNINGIKAKTIVTAKDNSEAGASLLLENNQLTISLFGDIPTAQKRGFLTIYVKNFQLQKGLMSNVSAGFTRYKDASGNTDADFSTDNGGNCTLTITKVEQTSNTPFIGDVYLLSGTFSIEMPLKKYNESKTKNISITNGKFDNLILQTFGKKK